MVLTEAMARGLAIVATCAGAAEATVPAQAAVKVQPGDAAGLAEAIALLLREEGQRRRLAEAAYALAQDLPRWSDTAARIARVVRQVTERSP
jgi:glycosyltransferase involved in cell wall biosynthesis